MHGIEYFWLRLNPVMRGLFLSLALAALATSCLLFTRTGFATATANTVPVILTGEDDAREAQVDWPRAAIRLWFLAPQFLPRGTR